MRRACRIQGRRVGRRSSNDGSDVRLGSGGGATTGEVMKFKIGSLAGGLVRCLMMFLVAELVGMDGLCLLVIGVFGWVFWCGEQPVGLEAVPDRVVVGDGGGAWRRGAGLAGWSWAWAALLRLGVF